MEKSATCLYRNLIYIKEHYPEVTATFLENVKQTETRIFCRNEKAFLFRKPKIIRIMPTPMPT